MIDLSDFLFFAFQSGKFPKKMAYFANLGLIPRGWERRVKGCVLKENEKNRVLIPAEEDSWCSGLV